MKRLSVILLVFTAAFASWAASLDDVRNAVKTQYIQSVPSAPLSSLMEVLDETGRWADIDYADKSPSLWQLEKHLDRMVDLALAYKNGNSSDSVLKSAIINTIDCWFDGNFTNPNWWYAKIGVPRRMLALAYILDEDLSPDHRARIDKTLDAIDSDDFPARPGGDRIQVLSNHAKVMLWRNDNEGVAEILKKIEAEARIAPHEEIMYDAGGNAAVRNDWRPSGRGVQADMSFHHRGDRVDSTVTYGLELPEYFSYWASLLKDTDYAFQSRAIHFIIDYFLDGVSRHLVAGQYVEPTILNRELSRPDAGNFNRDIIRKLIEISDGYREEELTASLVGDPASNPGYADYFHQSGYFAFSRPGFHSAVRMYSQRNANQEAPHNNEGIRNHFRGDGACMLSVSGREYLGIWPDFDFRMIPGATTPLIPYEPLESWGDVVVMNSPIKFAGAVTDSVYGAVGFDFQSSRCDLSARKGYFFFDDGYLCLGSGVSSTSPYEIVTTVEQSLSPSGSCDSSGNAYSHAGNTYTILQGSANGGVELRKGKWSNCVRNVEYADSLVENNVFTLSISHGTSPQEDRYAYYVSPESSGVATPSIQILSNEKECQAVASADGKTIYIILYEPGEIDTPAGMIGADSPCIIMIRDMSRIYVADPTHELQEVNLKTPGGTRNVHFPKGDDAGSSTMILI